MKLSRNLTLAVATASCALALVACKPIDKDAAAGAAKTDAKADEADFRVAHERFLRIGLVAQASR